MKLEVKSIKFKYGEMEFEAKEVNNEVVLDVFKKDSFDSDEIKICAEAIRERE